MDYERATRQQLVQRIEQLEAPYRIISEAVTAGVRQALAGAPAVRVERPASIPPSHEESRAIAVSVNEAAQMLGVDHKTVRREINRGELRALRVGRLLRVRVAEIEVYLRRKEERERRG